MIYDRAILIAVKFTAKEQLEMNKTHLRPKHAVVAITLLNEYCEKWLCQCMTQRLAHLYPHVCLMLMWVDSLFLLLNKSQTE